MIRRSWTQAASIEETVALWAASLREIKTRIRPLFKQERAATNAGGSAALMYFIPGASGDPSPARPWTSPGRGARPTGNACRQGPEPKDCGCMIGAISNWPISRSKNLAAQIKVFGHAVG